MPFTPELEAYCELLVQRIIQERDRSALDELIELHLEWAVCHARRFGPRAGADDVVQAAVQGVISAFYSSKWDFAGPGDFRRYFATAMRRQSQKEAKNKLRSTSLATTADNDDEIEIIAHDNPERELRRHDRIRWIWAALEDFRPRDREIMMRFMNDEPKADICSKVNELFPNEPTPLREESLHVKIAALKQKMAAYLKQHKITPSRLLTS